MNVASAMSAVIMPLPVMEPAFSVFTRHGTRKQYSASVRRPGKMSRNVIPTCTRDEARAHASNGTHRGTEAHKAWVATNPKGYTAPRRAA